jgi:hypothetical protein
MRAHIAEALPALKQRAQETHRIAAKLLTQRRPAGKGKRAPAGR